MITVIPPKLSNSFDLKKELLGYLEKTYAKDKVEKQVASCDFVNSSRVKVVGGLSKPDGLMLIEVLFPFFIRCKRFFDRILGNFESS
jgi:hypothetical protein